MRIRWLLIAGVLVTATAGCLGDGDNAAPSAGRRSVAAPGSRIDVLISVHSNFKPQRRFGLEIRRPGINALVCWSAAERAISRDPARFMDGNIDPTCIGGPPAFEMEVHGSINGKHFRMGQAIACDSPGINAWYALLRRYPAQPAWLRQANPTPLTVRPIGFRVQE
jgi:hypothetical protein